MSASQKPFNYLSDEEIEELYQESIRYDEEYEKILRKQKLKQKEDLLRDLNKL